MVDEGGPSPRVCRSLETRLRERSGAELRDISVIAPSFANLETKGRFRGRDAARLEREMDARARKRGCTRGGQNAS